MKPEKKSVPAATTLAVHLRNMPKDLHAEIRTKAFHTGTTMEQLIIDTLRAAFPKQ